MSAGKILVTGGAGFIGSNLAEALLEQGYPVVVLDNFSTGKRENLAAFAGRPDFTLLEGDICDFETCKQAVTGCETVFHEAALGSVPRSMADPQATLDTNVRGFNNMIEAARLANVKRFIYASSSSVYGDDPHPVKVETSVGRALSPYAFSKQTNEATAAMYEAVFGMKSLGLRYFNVFGKRQDPHSPYAAVIPKFIFALLRHESPVIHGDGTQSRDFTYVENVVQANLKALTATPLKPVCNVANGENTTLNELFRYLKEDLAGFDPAISGIGAQYGPPRLGDIHCSRADIARAKEILGYVPEFSFRDGLNAAVCWYYHKLENQK